MVFEYEYAMRIQPCSRPSFSLLVLGETKCLLHFQQTNSQLLTPTGIRIVLRVFAIGEDQRPIASGFFVCCTSSYGEIIKLLENANLEFACSSGYNKCTTRHKTA